MRRSDVQKHFLREPAAVPQIAGSPPDYSHHLNINGGRQPEIRIWGNHIRSKKIERIPGKARASLSLKSCTYPAVGDASATERPYVRILRSTGAECCKKIDTAIGQAMLSMMPLNSCVCGLLAISFSTWSHKAAVSQSAFRLRTHVQRNSPLSTDGKKSCPSHGYRAKERKQARRKPPTKNAAMTNQCFEQSRYALRISKAMLEPD